MPREFEGFANEGETRAVDVPRYEDKSEEGLIRDASQSTPSVVAGGEGVDYVEVLKDAADEDEADQVADPSSPENPDPGPEPEDEDA